MCAELVINLYINNNESYCEAQAMIGKGWPSRRKATKPKPLPRAYIKVGCHLPTTHQTFNFYFAFMACRVRGKGKVVRDH